MTMIRTLVIYFVSFSVVAGTFAQEFKEVPEFFELFKDRLTPLEEVIDGQNSFPDTKESGVILLRETFWYVGEDDVRYAVHHDVYKTLTESGVESVSKDSFKYRKSNEEIFLISAQTVQEDGTVTPIKENAAFIQSPQEGSDSDLYSDFNELVLIFPDVRVGSITESIVVERNAKPLVPGEFTRNLYFQSGWPIYKMRRVVMLPEQLADRVESHAIGLAVAERQETRADGRVEWTYVKRDINDVDWEVNREPFQQTGPVIRLTSFDSWDGVADWVRELASTRNILDDSLKAEIDQWTEGIESEEEIIEVIFDKVANDVRYTGLEFGLAGFQPYDCNVVWQNKYGDCKDKSNLLAAALNYKGIETYMALLDTEHLGDVHTQAPRPFCFNHAIAAIVRDDGY